MTLEELKSLKVWQTVKYTNDVDKLNVEYWDVSCVTDYFIEFHSCIPPYSYTTIKFSDPDIDHIASMLTVDRPLKDKVLEPKKQLERELRLVEAKIKDAEFDVNLSTIKYSACLSSNNYLTDAYYVECCNNSQILEELRNQRNELILKL